MYFPPSMSLMNKSTNYINYDLIINKNLCQHKIHSYMENGVINISNKMKLRNKVPLTIL